MLNDQKNKQKKLTRPPKFGETKTHGYYVLLTPHARQNLPQQIELQTGKKITIGDCLELIARGQLVLTEPCN